MLNLEKNIVCIPVSYSCEISNKNKTSQMYIMDLNTKGREFYFIATPLPPTKVPIARIPGPGHTRFFQLVLIDTILVPFPMENEFSVSIWDRCQPTSYGIWVATYF